MRKLWPKMRPKLWTLCFGALLLGLAPGRGMAAADARFLAVTDEVSYNVGWTVRLRVIPSTPETDASRFQFLVTLHYAGESSPLMKPFALPEGAGLPGVYVPLWKIPAGAKTGRYNVDIEAIDPATKKRVARLAPATSFAVHRKLVRIEHVRLGKTFYAPGDPVSCRVVLRNLSGAPLRGLRVEFSERYWPWIARSPEDRKIDVFPIVSGLTLRPGTATEVRSEKAAVARDVGDQTVQQYAVVVWDSARRTVYDIAFSPLTFIRPPGESKDAAYPLQYVFPKLSAVDTESYRQFSKRGVNTGAIQFDTARTMYSPGDEAVVKFTIANDTGTTWNGTTVRASLRALGSAEFGKTVVAENLTLSPRSQPIPQEVKFDIPSDGPGSYRVVVEIDGQAGQTLAVGELELAANPLPKSILIFCAHEDDEGAHRGIIRAAVENQVPVRLVYFTSGDAGSCDRYYQHSCSPAEALNFGAIRMEEARASVGHFGVPRENVFFLGLPDGGSEAIWYGHRDPAKPYLSVLLASDHAPYAGIDRPNLPFARRAVVDAARSFIARFKPDVIYTGHPDERHVDHRTNNWFVVEAMQELVGEKVISPDVELRVDQVYGPGPQKPAPYRYEKHILYVSPEARALGQESRWFYQSQSGNRDLGKIQTMEQLPRQEIHWKILDWNEHKGWNDAR